MKSVLLLLIGLLAFVAASEVSPPGTKRIARLAHIEKLHAEKRAWCGAGCDCTCMTRCWELRHHTPAQCMDECCIIPPAAPSVPTSTFTTVKTPAAALSKPKKRDPCDNGGMCQRGCDCGCIRNCQMSHNPTTCMAACCHACDSDPPSNTTASSTSTSYSPTSTSTSTTINLGKGA